MMLVAFVVTSIFIANLENIIQICEFIFGIKYYTKNVYNMYGGRL